EHGLSTVLFQREREIAQAYQVNGTPSAVVVSPSGTVTSPLVGGAEAIRTLLARTVGIPVVSGVPASTSNNHGNGSHGIAPRPGAKVGEATPDFSLPDLTGRLVAVSDFRGTKRVLVSWTPVYGF